MRDGTIWSQQAYLKASNTEAEDRFGTSVSVSGDTVVIGANREDSNAMGVDGDQGNDSAFDSGAAYVFMRGERARRSDVVSGDVNPAGRSAPGDAA